MKKLSYIILAGLFTSLYSCSSVNHLKRADKDIPLNSDIFMLLSGSYSNNSSDSTGHGHSFWKSFDTATCFNYTNYKITITVNDLNTLKLKLYYEDSVASVNMLHGHFINGYFVVDREWSTQVIGGPLLWYLTNNLRYIGINKNNNLVLLDGEKKVLVFLMLLPIQIKKMQYENEYKRIKR